jgi:hypothetical protein
MDTNHQDQTGHTLPPLDQAMYQAILEALEAKPAPAIPADFAARIAALAQSQPPPRLARPTHYGQTAARACLIVLAIAILALTPATLTPGTLHLSPLVLVQALLITQLLALALWLGSRRFPGTA